MLVEKKSKLKQKKVDKTEIGRQNILPPHTHRLTNMRSLRYTAKYLAASLKEGKSIHPRWVPKKMLRVRHRCNLQTYLASLEDITIVPENKKPQPKSFFHEWIKDLDVNEKMERLQKY